jgi:hypothetical protein
MCCPGKKRGFSASWQINIRVRQTLLPTIRGPGKVSVFGVAPARTALWGVLAMARPEKPKTYDRAKPSGEMFWFAIWTMAEGPMAPRAILASWEKTASRNIAESVRWGNWDETLLDRKAPIGLAYMSLCQEPNRAQARDNVVRARVWHAEDSPLPPVTSNLCPCPQDCK